MPWIDDVALRGLFIARFAFSSRDGPHLADKVFQLEDSLVLLLDDPTELVDAIHQLLDAVLAVGLGLKNIELRRHPNVYYKKALAIMAGQGMSRLDSKGPSSMNA